MHLPYHGTNIYSSPTILAFSFIMWFLTTSSYLNMVYGAESKDEKGYELHANYSSTDKLLTSCAALSLAGMARSNVLQHYYRL